MWELVLCSNQRVKVGLWYFKEVHIFSIQIWQIHVTALALTPAIPAEHLQLLCGSQGCQAGAQPPCPPGLGTPSLARCMNQICFDTCSQKSSRPESSWVWKNWLHQNHCSQKEIKPWLQSQSENQNNPPKASVYMCADVINIAKHICLSPPSQ